MPNRADVGNTRENMAQAGRISQPRVTDILSGIWTLWLAFFTALAIIPAAISTRVNHVLFFAACLGGMCAGMTVVSLQLHPTRSRTLIPVGLCGLLLANVIALVGRSPVLAVSLSVASMFMGLLPIYS